MVIVTGKKRELFWGDSKLLLDLCFVIKDFYYEETYCICELMPNQKKVKTLLRCLH